MSTVTGDIPRIPHRVGTAAARHAVALGRSALGDELLLLAVLELDPDQPARRALESEGVIGEQLLERIRVDGDGPIGSHGASFSPASYTVQGRAQGFAAALGDGAITPEHLLLSLLWHPVSTSSQILWRLGIGREQVVERMRDLGVAVPCAALPPQREIDWGERVWFARDEVTNVLSHLQQHLSPETKWGFNYAGERAWVIAERSVNLRALVDAAHARLAADDEAPS
ncbi:MAG: Clp protease N-terminal domain-containing protein [Chloroflexota bacterium]|nr:Clp protease N-terminal domain-containing protein [Chloroflexota bacterium]